jgi:hypothetical protein
MLDPMNLLSDFEDPAAAVVVQAGTPPRNGYWFTYGDPTCTQLVPANGAMYLPMVPPTPSPGPSGNTAIHAQWNGCSEWGAGIGADLAQPAAADGGMYDGPKVPYDLTGYKGVVFWGRTDPAADNKFRVKLNMRRETKIADGGTGATAEFFCDENDPAIGVGKCSDAWGQTFTLPIAGNWSQVVVMFSDTAKFRQEGWGKAFPWNPADVTSIQIQSQGTETSQPFDVWIDDVYLIK